MFFYTNKYFDEIYGTITMQFYVYFFYNFYNDKCAPEVRKGFVKGTKTIILKFVILEKHQ